MKKALQEKESPIEKQSNQERLLILTVDRDNDIGKLLGVSGPIVGYDNNLKLANDLILKDPEESDANAIFAALKKYSELKKDYEIEIATLTGHSKENLFFADKNISLQLKSVLETFPASAFIFVTDGAEDDQIIPILQNFGPIISKELVIVKQSKAIESTFYMIKKAINDPAFARIIFGIPAIILLLVFFFKGLALRIIILVLGLYLLVRGFNLEAKLINFFKGLASKFSLTRISFPFYIASLFFLIYVCIDGTNLFFANSTFVMWQRIIFVIRAELLYLVLCAGFYVLGNIIDIIYQRALYKLGSAIFALVAVFVFSGVLDLSFQFILGEIEFTSFIVVILFSSLFLFILHMITGIFDITKDVTELLIGLPVISKYGVWLGEVISVDKDKKTISYKSRNGKVITVISQKHFFIQEGQVII